MWTQAELQCFGRLDADVSLKLSSNLKATRRERECALPMRKIPHAIPLETLDVGVGMYLCEEGARREVHRTIELSACPEG